jgi:N-acyl-D-amino-acid deacylase
LRIWEAGLRQGALSKRELDAMQQRLAEELQEGACGFSTGLMYAPGSSAPREELVALCAVVARHDKTYATHMRDYSDRLVEAVDEQIELARQTGCRLQISHLQAVGARNWPLQQVALERIERARDAGIDVTFDCYPYICGSTVLTQLLPQWVLDGGVGSMVARLADPELRPKISARTDADLAQGWNNIFIAAVASPKNRGLVGKSVAEIASVGQPPVEAAIDLLIEEQGQVNMLEVNQSEANLRQTLSHPLSNVISDGFYVQGRPHPRLSGTFPLLLGEICLRRGWLTLPEAIRKITDLPAQRFRIPKRGRLAPGYFADVTVFDPATVGSPATYENPRLAPMGIRHVFRNGRQVCGAADGWTQ